MDGVVRSSGLGWLRMDGWAGNVSESIRSHRGSSLRGQEPGLGRSWGHLNDQDRALATASNRQQPGTRADTETLTAVAWPKCGILWAGVSSLVGGDTDGAVLLTLRLSTAVSQFIISR